MIKLIASDIDGTLVSEGAHTISPEYYKVIEELADVGISFCACSGRQYQSMLDLFRPVSDMIYFIAENGTILRTTTKIFHSWKLEEDLVIPIIEAVRKIDGASIGIETLEQSYIEDGEDSDFMHLMRDEYHYDVVNVEDLTKLPLDGIVKIAILHPHAEAATEELRNDPRYENISMVISGEKWLDIMPREAGKGEAFALLQELLGVKKEETVYFGDNLNDLSAFKETGVAVTVANARRELKDAADIVELSYKKLGVLHELRNILGYARDYIAANGETE